MVTAEYPPARRIVLLPILQKSWMCIRGVYGEAASGAERGAYVDGTLRYQACDQAACYPPKSLPVEVIFTAK